MNENEIITEGFDAISSRLQKLYPGQKEMHYGTLLPAALGGNDPLDGIGVWKSEKGEPHWHYVTYGFTELYGKESDDKETSGYGFELTFRLERGDEEEPPVWPLNLLQNLARYVFSTGNVFDAGHHMSCNGPVALETDTRLTALGFQMDEELGEMDTVNGHMVFLQAVAITGDEMEALMCWSGEKFLALLGKQIPFCITKLSRDSLMENRDFATEWEMGVEKDGSSTGFLYMNEVGARKTEDGRGIIRLGAGHVRTLSTMLRARIGKGNTLYIQGTDFAIGIQPGESVSFIMGENGFAEITLNPGALEELCSLLRPKAGVYPLKSSPLALELAVTNIKDRDGNILETIG